jgi:hypothetical protein
MQLSAGQVPKGLSGYKQALVDEVRGGSAIQYRCVGEVQVYRAL